jgi:predicted DNA-binding transcriptional regulator AlpA
MKVVFDDGEFSYTVEQIAKKLEITMCTIRMWQKKNKLPKPDETVGRTQYWRESTIDKWIKTLKKRYCI